MGITTHANRSTSQRSWIVELCVAGATAALIGCGTEAVDAKDVDTGTEVVNAADTDSNTDTDTEDQSAETDTDRDSASDGLANGWEEIFPGGDTTCARGAPFSFFVRQGTVNKVVVDFWGGGACWDAVSCATSSNLFIDSVDPFRDWINGKDPFGVGALDGIYDRSNEENPFKDWHHLIIPYCTADVHWGDAEQDFGDFHIEFRGAVNARAALDWLYGNFDAPEHIFVTGCSAGSPASALWFAHVARHYKNSKIAQFGDSFAGIITPEFFENGFPLWNAQSVYPDWIPDFDPKSTADIYIALADYYSAHFMSQFNSLGDSGQRTYYMAMGGGSRDEWAPSMLNSLAAIEAGADNFASFVANGDYHCILPRKAFYTLSADGTALLDWINDILQDGTTQSVQE